MPAWLVGGYDVALRIHYGCQVVADSWVVDSTTRLTPMTFASPLFWVPFCAYALPLPCYLAQRTLTACARFITPTYIPG